MSFQIRILHSPQQGTPSLFVQLNSDQDIILINRILQNGDTVTTMTSRKISNGTKSVTRISFLATITLESFELFKDESNCIKLVGKLIKASDPNIQLHGSQTIIIDKTSKITIQKSSIEQFDMEIIQQQQIQNQFAICIICQTYAKFSCQCSYTYSSVKTIQYKQIVKTLYNANKIVEQQDNNIKKTFEQLQTDIDKYKPSKLYIVASNMIFSQLKQNKHYSQFLQNNQDLEIDQTIQTPETNFSKIFQEISQNNLFQQINKFKQSILSEDHLSAIGIDAEQIIKTQLSSIDVVIISENALGFDKTQEIKGMLKQNQQIKLLYADTDQDASDYLQTMTGLIVLLKYPIYIDGLVNQKVGKSYTEKDWQTFQDI